jgi:hypothetical protein
VLPPWSFYNQHPVQWLPSIQIEEKDKPEQEEVDALKEKST